MVAIFDWLRSFCVCVVLLDLHNSVYLPRGVGTISRRHSVLQTELTTERYVGSYYVIQKPRSTNGGRHHAFLFQHKQPTYGGSNDDTPPRHNQRETNRIQRSNQQQQRQQINKMRGVVRKAKGGRKGKTVRLLFLIYNQTSMMMASIGFHWGATADTADTTPRKERMNYYY